MMAGDSHDWQSDHRSLDLEQKPAMVALMPPNRAVRAQRGFGNYMPKLPVELDSGTADPDIRHAAVLGYN